MSPGATFERVYLALKAAITSGEMRPGQHLEPRALAEDLAASITPVRDALHRLVGERLVETPRSDGFRVVLLNEAMLRDLYGWNARLLQSALSSRARSGTRASSASAGGTAAETKVADLFLRIARLSGSQELVRAVAGANERLNMFRIAEAEVIEDEAEELTELRRVLEAADLPQLRCMIAVYHRRRARLVPDLLARLPAPL